MSKSKKTESRAMQEMRGNNKTKMTAEPGGREVVITQVFDAPREQVFKAFSDPSLIPEWWGPKYLSTTVEKMDVRPGGSWRIIQRDPTGNKYGFHGVYHDVVPPERSVRTSEFEGMRGHVSLETANFEERDGRTVVTTIVVFQTVEDRDAAVKSGMEKGVVESRERFAELLARR